MPGIQIKLRKTISINFLCTVLLYLSLVALPIFSANATSEFTLKLHHQLGPKAPAHINMLVPWSNRIEKASNDRVKIEIYPSMSLGGKPQELFSQIRDGVVDIGWLPNGYNPGLFPRSEVFELPFIHTNNAVATNLAIHGMFDQYLKDDYESVHVLFNHVHAGQGIHMADKPVHSPDDLIGSLIRTPSRTGVWIIEALGANPVGMPLPTLPQALSKKVVDGALIPWEIIVPFKLQELTRYQIEGVNKTRFGTVVFQVSMNKDTWNSLPSDIQDIFTESSGKQWVREVGKIWQDADDHGIAIAMKTGNKHITLSQEQTNAFRIKLEPVVDRWIQEVSNKGIDGVALVKAARNSVEYFSSK